MTHLGITLQRHCVVSGLRYTLYHLGFPLPEKAPVKIHQLRLYLDAEALEERLRGHRGAREIAGALLDPGGKLAVSEQSGEVAAAALFHRFRLATLWRRRPPELAEPADGATAWKLFRAGVSRWLDRLNDAFLADTMAARDRRRRRSEGREVAPTLSGEAWAFRSERKCRLDCLGSPDFFAASWGEDRACRDQARRMLEDEPLPAKDTRRGAFRETYRDMLSHLRPAFLALARTAHERGVLEYPDDAFFVPFDLVGDLTGSQQPGWLEEAVTTNRHEYESLANAEALGEELHTSPTLVVGEPPPPEAAWGCVLPIA